MNWSVVDWSAVILLDPPVIDLSAIAQSVSDLLTVFQSILGLVNLSAVHCSVVDLVKLLPMDQYLIDRTVMDLPSLGLAVCPPWIRTP